MLEIRLRFGPRGSAWDFRHHRAVRAVELGGALSRSRLWGLQRQRALADGTTGLAPGWRVRAFADLLRAWPGDGRLDVLEVGAASIRPALALLEAAGEGIRCVVTTDHPDALATWRGDPSVRALERAGRLVLGAWDLLSERAPTLDGELEGDRLAVISHGYLGWLPVDLLRIAGGALSEGMIELSSATSVPDPPRPADVDRLRVRVSWRDGAPHHDDPRLGALVAGYGETLDGVVVQIPVGAVAALDRIRALGAGPTLVLAAEEGDATLADLARATPADGLSLRVNLHALATVADVGWVGRPRDGDTVAALAFGVEQDIEAPFRARFGAPDTVASVAEAWGDVLATRDLRAVSAVTPEALEALSRASAHERAALADALTASVNELTRLLDDPTPLARLLQALHALDRPEEAARLAHLLRP